MLDIFLNSIKELYSSLRYVFCSGEKLNLNQVQRFHKKLYQTKINNLYGPTEASIDVLSYDCNDKKIKKVYIGRAIENITAYIVDSKSLNPLPIGAIGELYIGGVGLARGYLNKAGLTAEKFIANPFQTEKERKEGRNSRLYKTGDLARWGIDGNIEYVGRNDYQVKIRGYRIELGEIEAELLTYQGIEQVVVIAREHKGIVNGNK